VATQNHYVAQVKGNQKNLLKEIHRMIVEQAPIDQIEVQEKGHGRISSWSVSVFDAQDSPKAKEWNNLRRVIHVHRTRQKNGRCIHSDSFYISDLFETDAATYHHGIRGHWGIENRLHYVKDVIHQEDHNGIRTEAGPMVASVLSTIAINLHRKNGFQSITDAQAFAIQNIETLFCYIRT